LHLSYATEIRNILPNYKIKHIIFSSEGKYLLLAFKENNSRRSSGIVLNSTFGCCIELNLENMNIYSGGYIEDFRTISVLKSCNLYYEQSEWIIRNNDLNKLNEEEIDFIKKYITENKPSEQWINNRRGVDLTIYLVYNRPLGENIFERSIRGGLYIPRPNL